MTKIPKWDLAKFSAQVNREVGSSMKSVGEVMAIGRTFEESLQKAIRQVDPRWRGFEAYVQPEDLDRALSKPTDMRLFAIAYAMYNKNYTVDQIHDLNTTIALAQLVKVPRQCLEIGRFGVLYHSGRLQAVGRLGKKDRNTASDLDEAEYPRVRPGGTGKQLLCLDAIGSVAVFVSGITPLGSTTSTEPRKYWLMPSCAWTALISAWIAAISAAMPASCA